MVYIDDDMFAPMQLKDTKKPSLSLWVNPLLEGILTKDINDLKFDTVEIAKESISQYKRLKIDLIDIMNLKDYTNFSNPIIAIVTTHPSINYPTRNPKFY